jgi:hypothetical protein
MCTFLNVALYSTYKPKEEVGTGEGAASLACPEPDPEPHLNVAAPNHCLEYSLSLLMSDSGYFNRFLLLLT